MFLINPYILQASGGSYILDTYGSADIAYSIRKLSSSYTGACMRIRRSSDNAEQDINFVSDFIDTSTMLSFVGANNGFVVKWYDQSGNANDSLQSTAGIQPQIISSGSLVVSTNGMPLITQGTDIYKTLNLTSTVTFGAPFHHTAVLNRAVNTNKYATIGGSSSVSYAFQYTGSVTARIQDYPTTVSFTCDNTVGEKIITSYRKASLLSGIYINNIQQDTEKSLTNQPTYNLIRILNVDNTQGNSNLQECIFWSQDYTANINDINTEINNYYGIY